MPFDPKTSSACLQDRSNLENAMPKRRGTSRVCKCKEVRSSCLPSSNGQRIGVRHSLRTRARPRAIVKHRKAGQIVQSICFLISFWPEGRARPIQITLLPSSVRSCEYEVLILVFTLSSDFWVSSPLLSLKSLSTAFTSVMVPFFSFLHHPPTHHTASVVV